MFDSAHLLRLQAIGLTPHFLELLTSADDGAPMRVSVVQRDAVTLHDGGHELGARVLPAVTHALAAASDAIAVGDWVLARRNALGEWWVYARLPPATQIARRHHDGRDKVTRAVVVANVDTALLVMGLDGDYNLRRLERYVALVRLAGVASVVVLTKADLCTAVDERVQAVRALLPPDAAVLALDATGDAAPALLAPWLVRGSTLVALGSSGVGKSTLTNALLGRTAQDTGANRRGDDRGRHTTTSRSLHVLPGGACLIDTPGLRTLRLDGEAGDIAGAFDDIAGLAQRCRFRDCSHAGEPGCAVQAEVAPERLHSFQKLLREASRDALSARQKKELVSVWKARGLAARANMRAKRGE